MSRVPAAKRRRLSPPEDEPKGNISSKSAKNAAQWDLEQDYESRPRKLKEKAPSRLPIKTAEGWVAQPVAPEEEEEVADSDSFLGTSSDDDGSEDEEEEEEVEEAPKVSARQQILEAKEELARLAGLINEDPEEHTGVLKQLAKLASNDNVTVKKLVLATQLAVYKDIIPSYRIRPLSEEDMTAKISKEVRRLRNFEQGLVHGYQEYVKELATCAKGSKTGASEEERGLATVAISCACNLLTAVPHFNFRGDVLKILVDKLSTRGLDADFAKCRETLETLFEQDEDGNASLDAVQMLTKMIKGRHYIVHESVLNTFLHLRLLSEFAGKGSMDKVENTDQDGQLKGKKPKMKKEFRTKKQRKLLREHKAIEKEMKEADAAVSHEERDRMQAETLKLVFVTYFRILKARTPSLMGAVLEGLARYAHLINQDFFGDILEALKDLIAAAEVADEDLDEDENEQDDASARNATRESLLCVITAFALLQGQDASKAASTLHLDLNFFITHLYRTLYPVSLNADIELSANSLHLPDPNAPDAATASQRTPSTNKVNVQTTAVLLLRSLSSVLLPPTAIRAVPPLRLAAFTKQLLTASLHLPEKSCQALTALLAKLTKVHARKVAGLWNTEERKGDGVFDPLRAEIEGSNPFAATVWEGELLRLHFSPSVREMLGVVERNVLDTQ